MAVIKDRSEDNISRLEVRYKDPSFDDCEHRQPLRLTVDRQLVTSIDWSGMAQQDQFSVSVCDGQDGSIPTERTVSVVKFPRPAQAGSLH